MDVVDDDSVLDGVGNPLGGTGVGNGAFTTGDVFTIDKTAPTVVSSERLNGSPTKLSTVYYKVTFSEPVSGVDVTDFTLTTNGGITGASITNLVGVGTVR